MTPEQVARDRELAALLAREGANYSPIGHVTQGLARLANAWSGRAWRDQADADEATGREGYAQRWADVFGGGGGGGGGGGVSPVAAALADGSPGLEAIEAIAPGGSPAIPGGDTAGYIRAGLINRGLPEHVADAFILNMQDESGLNPGINEIAPIVPGSRGGYGLYQLTGPRRRDYEAFASQRGVGPEDIDAQLDFLMYELQGPESAAARNILNAQATGTAAAAIVNDFLRPAAEHRERRAAAYLGGQPMRADASPVAQALGAGMGGGGGGYDMNALIGLASDPWASPAQQQIVSALMGQQMQAQAQANDPLRQLQIQQIQQALRMGELDYQNAINPPAPFQPRTLTPEEMTQWGLSGAPGSWIMTDPNSPPTQLWDGPGGDPDSAAEAEINRLVELGYSRDEAIGIRDLYRLGQDETGRSVLINRATGEAVAPIGGPAMQSPQMQPPMSPFDATFGAVAGATDPALQAGLAGGGAANYSTLPAGTDVGAALGLEGVLSGGINTVADFLFGTAPVEEQQQAANFLQNLRLQTNQALLEGFAGRTNVYTQEMIDQLAVNPGMPPSAAADRFAQTYMLIEQQLARLQNEVLDNPQNWTPAEVREARSSAATLRGLLDTYRDVLNSLRQREEQQNSQRPPLETFVRQ